MSAPPDLLEELTAMVEALRHVERGSDDQLALLDAAHDTLIVYTMQELGVEPAQVERLWRAAGLHAPLSFVKKREA
jgi:hypothetical protein